MGFDDRARGNAEDPEPDNPESEAQHHTFNDMPDESVRRIYRLYDPNGPRDFELWSLYYDVEATAVGGGFSSRELLQMRDSIALDFPGQTITVGAWWTDTGDQVLNQAGTQAQFTIDPLIIEFMPDVYPPDSDVGTRPTVPYDVNLGYGHAPRDFS